MLLFPGISQKQVTDMVELRKHGMTYRQMGRKLRRDPGCIAKYLRNLERWGIEAFAK